jgi:hypothetical protein
VGCDLCKLQVAAATTSKTTITPYQIVETKSSSQAIWFPPPRSNEGSFLRRLGLVFEPAICPVPYTFPEMDSEQMMAHMDEIRVFLIKEKAHCKFPRLECYSSREAGRK